MPQRTVTTGVATYTAEGGLMQFALHGATVNVAEEDLDRFDRLNGGAPAKPSRKPKYEK